MNASNLRTPDELMNEAYAIKAELDALQERMANGDEPTQKEIEALDERCDRVLARARELVQAEAQDGK